MMAELPRYKVAPFLVLSRVEMYSDEQIVDMLNKAEALGFNLNDVPSALEDLTLRELWILTQDAGPAC